MSEEQEPWARMPGEPLLWYQRFDKFRLMEPIHSIPDVYFEEHPTSTDVKQRQKVPGAWYEKAKQWQWEERTAAWDAHLDAQIEKRIAAERKRTLRSAYALLHKRVEILNRKITQLDEITEDDNKIWLADVKAVGTGEFAERVDLLTFNDAAFRELREYLTDIADEMGERVKLTKQELTGRDGEPLQTIFYLPKLAHEEGYDG